MSNVQRYIETCAALVHGMRLRARSIPLTNGWIIQRRLSFLLSLTLKLSQRQSIHMMLLATFASVAGTVYARISHSN